MLMGPTASGKTGLVVDWIKKFPIEIISVDSALVYRGMDIGTAKPDLETLSVAPHRLIDIRDPRESYSVADFRKDALLAIKDIQSNGNIPVFAGGTMLYYRSLLHGLSDIPATTVETRALVSEQAEGIGWNKMHGILHEIDPLAAQRIHPNDPQRIQRAIEVYRQTGICLTDWQKKKSEPWPFKTCSMIISPKDRAILHERIQQRLDIMFSSGFIEEVKQLMKLPGLTSEHTSMRSVGYRQVLSYLEGEISEQEMKDKSLFATRQLAKRQFTWLRKEKDAIWSDSAEELTHVLEEFLAQ